MARSGYCAFNGIFSHPVKFFVRRRLGIELPRERNEVEDREPFELHSLKQYNIEQELLDDVLDGIAPDSAFASVRALGVLPPGGTGRLKFDELCGNVTAFAQAIRERAQVQAQPPMMIRAELGDFILGGRIDRVRGDMLLRYRLTTLKPKDFLRIWIEHLTRNLTERKPALLFGKEEQEIAAYEFPSLENARELLSDLLSLYWRGLSEPLRFFPRTSWAFAQAIAEGKDHIKAALKAEQIWRGNEREGRGEREESYLKLAFRNVGDVLNEDWEETSRRVLLPLLQARDDRRI